MKTRKTMAFLLFFITFSLYGCNSVSEKTQTVITEIDNLGEISLESANDLTTTYSHYQELSKEDKSNVKNYDTLEAAIKKFDQLTADNLLDTLEDYTYANVNVLSACIDSLWEYFDDEEKETVLSALGRCKMESEFESRIKKRL